MHSTPEAETKSSGAEVIWVCEDMWKGSDMASRIFESRFPGSFRSRISFPFNEVQAGVFSYWIDNRAGFEFFVRFDYHKTWARWRENTNGDVGFIITWSTSWIFIELCNHILYVCKIRFSRWHWTGLRRFQSRFFGGRWALTFVDNNHTLSRGWNPITFVVGILTVRVGVLCAPEVLEVIVQVPMVFGEGRGCRDNKGRFPYVDRESRVLSLVRKEGWAL